MLRSLIGITVGSVASVWLTATVAAADGGSITDVADVPASFALSDREPIATVHAAGAQIYECKTATNGTRAWLFREPIAALFDNGKTIGRHYAGPNWDFSDGSGVTGKLVSSAPGASPDDIPQLALQVVAHRGDGALAKADVVVRLRTSGGVLKGPCDHAGDLRAVPYTADYLFLR